MGLGKLRCQMSNVCMGMPIQSQPPPPQFRIRPRFSLIALFCLFFHRPPLIFFYHSVAPWASIYRYIFGASVCSWEAVGKDRWMGPTTSFFFLLSSGFLGFLVLDGIQFTTL
ncbi:hypothetical protein FRC16_005512 [Serendipita sp. 398]|nr:hypothetical protein FRC16_005512 [Serendipita sp. 398]